MKLGNNPFFFVGENENGGEKMFRLEPISRDELEKLLKTRNRNSMYDEIISEIENAELPVAIEVPDGGKYWQYTLIRKLKKLGFNAVKRGSKVIVYK